MSVLITTGLGCEVDAGVSRSADDAPDWPELICDRIVPCLAMIVCPVEGADIAILLKEPMNEKEDIGEGIIFNCTIGCISDDKSKPIAAEVVASGVVDAVVLLIILIIEANSESEPLDCCTTASVGVVPRSPGEVNGYDGDDDACMDHVGG